MLIVPPAPPTLTPPPSGTYPQWRTPWTPPLNITSDPNREDDPRYITRLVAQVIRVSLETMKIVTSLPAEYSDAANS